MFLQDDRLSFSLHLQRPQSLRAGYFQFIFKPHTKYNQFRLAQVCERSARERRRAPFSQLAKWGKQFLNVKWDNSGKFDSPIDFLEDQISAWSGLWAPDSPNFDNENVALELSMYRKHALEFSRSQEFRGNQLHKSASTYKKNSPGSDIWSLHELAALPCHLCDGIAACIQHSLRTAAWPHQSLYP